MSQSHTEVTSSNSAVWDNHITVPDTPEGFTVRTTYPTNPDGVEVMLEQWRAGSAEPPHSHPGDDMTIVVEGRMSVQFFIRQGDALVADGEPLVLCKGIPVISVPAGYMTPAISKTASSFTCTTGRLVSGRSDDRHRMPLCRANCTLQEGHPITA